MKISANDIKIGNVISHDNKYLVILKTMHTQPGKGGAYIQLEMKDIKTGTKMNHRFRSTEDVEKIRLDQQRYQFLYEEGNFLVLMDQENFEQKSVDKSLVGEQLPYLKEGMEVTLETYDNESLLIYLPTSAEVIIKECEPVVKGQTSTSSYKPAIMSNGMKISVPQYITIGEKILVKTEDNSFVERVK